MRAKNGNKGFPIAVPGQPTALHSAAEYGSALQLKQINTICHVLPQNEIMLAKQLEVQYVQMCYIEPTTIYYPEITKSRKHSSHGLMLISK